MWKPAQPIVIAGAALSPQEAWWHEFRATFYDKCDGAVDREWLDMLTFTLYPLNADRDPRKAAEVAYVTLKFEFPADES